MRRSAGCSWCPCTSSTPSCWSAFSALTAWWGSGNPAPNTDGRAATGRRLGVGAARHPADRRQRGPQCPRRHPVPVGYAARGSRSRTGVDRAVPAAASGRASALIAIAVALGVLFLVMRLGEGANDRTRRIGVVLADHRRPADVHGDRQRVAAHSARDPGAPSRARRRACGSRTSASRLPCSANR